MRWSSSHKRMEAKTSLDNNVDRDDLKRKNVRPPANLLVFEGDSLDSEASELDSYLLATCDFYGDFLLLDPCDAPAVFEFLQGKCSGEENSVARQGSSAPSKSRPCAFTSPNGRSGGIGRKSALGKGQGDLDPTQENPSQSSANKTPDNLNADYRDWSDPHDPGFPGEHIPDPDDLEDPMDPAEEDSDDEDTWRPLNPHEPGNLKIRPYKRVKGSARQVVGTAKKKTLTSLFPMAKMDSVIIPEHTNAFEAQQSQQEEFHPSQSPPPYEKHMRSFQYGDPGNPDAFGDSTYDTGPNFDNGFDGTDDPGSPMFDEFESPTCPENKLLASIAEVEQQSEMDARVSTWKERIELALEEQDKNPPFDIGSYGEQILDTLSSRTDGMGIASFSEIVSGKPKYEVARTFSAMLQLVNGRSVDLDKGQATNELVCYTAENPFHVKLIGPNRRPEMEARFARKRGKSPLQDPGKGVESSLAQQESLKKPSHKNGKIPVKSAIRLTPDGKRRRRSAPHLMQPINLESSR